MRLLLLAFLLLPLSPLLAVTLTEEQEKEYIVALEAPEVKAIREYLNDCLSGAEGIGYPCEIDPKKPRHSIRAQPKEHVNGRFLVLRVDPFEHQTQGTKFGGNIFVILFDKAPHLMAHIWVYPLGGNLPVVRSFYIDKASEEDRRTLAQQFASLLNDPRMTR